jgi:hypothetical protein
LTATRCRRLLPITASDAGASLTLRGRDLRCRDGRRCLRGWRGGRGTLLDDAVPAGRGTSVTGAAFGSPTSAESGGGSGARRKLGSRRTASRPTRAIAATFATPRHLIRTSAIPL